MKLTSALESECEPCCKTMRHLTHDGQEDEVDPVTGNRIKLVLRVSCDDFTLRVMPAGGTFEDEIVLTSCPWCWEPIIDCYEGTRWDMGPFALCVYVPDCMACKRGVSIQGLAPAETKKLLGTNRMQLCGGHHEEFVRNGGKTMSEDSILDPVLRERARNQQA